MTTKSRAVSVGTTATDLLSTADDNRAGRSIAVFNNDDTDLVYLGGADVTTANGVPVPAGTWGPGMDLGDDDQLYGRTASGTVEVRVIETGV